ncbi:predicted protein [Sclerotinia sclerotiorum 1980 UF-70]|uniref:Uncharacterized protein n=1 Tax=Sclerotinia sclerotiorum (strain ATCC 18683 / 1980 / Ss-1) TaxID=665079 RepID=A7EUK2_SCLS1|nr:predicted protein [Sclerotinia sclerotiorum 1980 UF-70]EDN93144.1 predicted protein [Sclerotinia sclerotiorum 1980 UF-70]
MSMPQSSICRIWFPPRPLGFSSYKGSSLKLKHIHPHPSSPPTSRLFMINPYSSKPNCAFEVEDLNIVQIYLKAHFDIIHIRELFGCWGKIFGKSSTILKESKAKTKAAVFKDLNM